MRSRIKNLKMDPLPMPILIRMLGSTLLIFVCTGCIADIGNSLNASADPVHLAPAKRTESMKEKEYAQKIAKLSRKILEMQKRSIKGRSPTSNSTALRKAMEIGHKLRKT
jgi:hypothetical protein